MSIHKLGPREWRIVWELGVDPATHKRRQKTERFAGTKGQALERYVARQKDLNDGIGVRGPGLTLALLADEWLAHKRSQHRKPSTIQRYQEMLRDYIVPQLGSVPVEDLTPLHVQRALRQWQTQSRQDRRADRATVSPRTVRYAYGTLSTLLTQAVRWQLVGRNVAHLVDAPPVPRADERWWTADQAAAFLRTTADHPYNIVFALALLTGLRQGELLGLQWAAIDWDTATLAVRRSQDAHHVGVFDTPKTPASRRTIHLDAMTLDLLRSHRLAQKRQRLAAGPAWHEGDLVCASGLGTPLNPSNVRRVLVQYTARAGVPRIKFHALRHTHASLFLQHEPNIRILADRLGHTQVSFTIQTYVHASTDAQARPASGVARSLLDSGGSSS